MIKIIILENIKKLGMVGDIIFVKRGFFLNYLFRYNKAIKYDKNFFLKNFFFFNSKIKLINFKKLNFLNLILFFLNKKQFFIEEFVINKNNIIYLLKFNGFNFNKDQIVSYGIFNNKSNLYYVILNILGFCNIKFFILLIKDFNEKI